MHEMAVTESILNIAMKHALQANAMCVKDINIVVGSLSSIVDDSVQFYWDMISENTICAGAKLHFQKLPARILCLDCSKEYEIQQELMPCPDCESMKVQVLSGNEFWLESIEVQ